METERFNGAAELISMARALPGMENLDDGAIVARLLVAAVNTAEREAVTKRLNALLDAHDVTFMRQVLEYALLDVDPAARELAFIMGRNSDNPAFLQSVLVRARTLEKVFHGQRRARA